MEESITHRARALLRDWLRRQLTREQNAWLDGQGTTLEREPTDTNLDIALGMVPRRLGKADLALAQADLAAASGAIAGWSPRGWTVADAARIFVLSGLSPGSKPFAQRFTELCRTADVSELITLYRGLPLYPEPRALEPQVGEGLRSNMRAVFEAIAHDNPYPKTYFDQHRWNHMVLKVVFIGSSLAPIQGLDERANAELAQILCDFAHERWAADRSVPYEVWRCVGPFAEGRAVDDLARVLGSDEQIERRAAALALAASPDRKATQLLKDLPALAADIEGRKLTWATLQTA
jgi:hypothetical protein